MKTSLAIATIALVFSAILSLAPTVATADYSHKTPGRCGVVPCPKRCLIIAMTDRNPPTAP
jgi:hypothetical protein